MFEQRKILNEDLKEKTFITCFNNSNKENAFAFAFAFAFGVDYVQRWGRPSIAAQCATPDITKG